MLSTLEPQRSATLRLLTGNREIHDIEPSPEVRNFPFFMDETVRGILGITEWVPLSFAFKSFSPATAFVLSVTMASTKTLRGPEGAISKPGTP